MRAFFSIFGALALASCGPSTQEGPVDVAIIGNPESLAADGLRLSTAAQHLRAATSEGLVGLDANGDVIPGLAERWIVTDDGLSYIFRLRNSEWPDAEPLTGAFVAEELKRSQRALRNTSLGLDLAKIDEIRAMTGRVIEVTLTSPSPDFLRVLAQPELGIRREGQGGGPMGLAEDSSDQPIALNPLPPELRGLPSREEWQSRARQVTVSAMSASDATAAFANGDIDLVLNGRLESLPLADTGPLTRGTIRLDAALGLFGLMVRKDEGFLSDPLRRQAINLAIDREGLWQAFNVGGWQASSWIVPAELASGQAATRERFEDLSLQQRREIAASRVSAWERGTDEEVVLRIGLPDGPGSDTLFEQLAGDLGLIGITAIQVGMGEGAELELRDRLARFYSPRWFLNQFHCRLDIGLCSEEADDLVEQSIVELDPARKSQLLAAAHTQLIESEIYIPLGAPVRWSLVRGGITGFEPNRWGIHPLFPLSQPPT